MPVTFTNSKGQYYYLHIGRTKKGTPQYFFSLKSEGHLAKSLPEGYEIYENPNCRVFLRKIQPKIIRDDEISIVAEGIKRYKRLKNCKIDVKKGTISIYSPDQDVNRLIEIAKEYNTGTDIEAILREITYSPILQFVLIDEDKRLFVTQRWCFLGSIDDWIDIGKADKLENLVKEYIKHIGEDSYFELF